MASEKTWLRYTHAAYDEALAGYTFAADHLMLRVLEGASQIPATDTEVAEPLTTGKGLGELLGTMPRGKITHYLVRKTQGETPLAYRERARIADYTAYFTNAVVTLAGMVFAAERTGANITREWGMLGDPEDDKTPMGRSRRDIDGEGTDYGALIKQATTRMIAKRDEYVRASVEGDTLRAYLLDAEAVLDWSSSEEPWAKVAGMVEDRTSPKEDYGESLRERFFLYWPDRVETWHEVENDAGKPVPEMLRADAYKTDADAFSLVTDKASRRPALPLFRVRLLAQPIGYMMARKANAIFNLESTLDFQLWTATFAKLFADVTSRETGEIFDDLYAEIIKAISEGRTVIPQGPNGGHAYASPPVTGADIKRLVLAAKVEAFYRTFFQSFQRAAVEQTATEVRFDFWNSVEAILSIIASAVDEIENRLFFLWEQMLFPSDSDKWGLARVDRSAMDFSEVDLSKAVTELVDRTLPGGRLILDAGTMLRVEERYLRSKGLPLDSTQQTALKGAIAQALEAPLSENGQAPAPVQ
jgi:hypothetical protein